MKTTPANFLLLASSFAPVAYSTVHSRFGTLKPRPELDVQISAIRDTAWANALRNAVGDPAVHGCYNPSTEFMFQLVGNIGKDDYVTMTDTGIDMLPTFYSLLRNPETAEEQYFGTFGEETEEITAAFDACKEFWSSSATGGQALTTENIELLAMHGADMKDLNKLLPTLEYVYDLDGTGITYEELAREIQEFIETLPHEYDNPILTFNAYASSAEGDERIVMGDGIIEFQHYLNTGNNGPHYILGHEFGHQMQYETKMIDPESDQATTPEESRHIELMADALGGYFLAHPLGGKMEDVQITELHEAAFAVGDCNDSSEGHHGTPKQRECALIWGASKASSGLRGTLLHPDALANLFEEDLPRILALDETLCQPDPAASPLGALHDGGDSRNAAGGVTTVTTTTTTVTTTTSANNV